MSWLLNESLDQVSWGLGFAGKAQTRDLPGQSQLMSAVQMLALGQPRTGQGKPKGD